MEIPFVAVWMITYNHEAFIAQAIESVMMQNTTFPYKLYIGEDCSTDNTRNICIALKNKYPDKIELLLNKENNIKQNSKNVYNACFISGATYIALLDGDDYWTDSLKLQKQVDFLENNKDFSICFHNTEVIYTDENKKAHPSNPIYSKDEFTVYDLIRGERFQSLSCIFRYGLFENLPDWFFDAPAGDIILHMINSYKGKIKYFPKIMGVYRIHKNSIWSTTLNKEVQLINHLTTLELIINYDFDDLVVKEIKEKYVNTGLLLYQYYFSKKDFYNAQLILNKIKSITELSFIDKINWLHTEYMKLRTSKSFRIGNQIVNLFKRKN